VRCSSRQRNLEDEVLDKVKAAMNVRQWRLNEHRSTDSKDKEWKKPKIPDPSRTGCTAPLTVL
jgi:hypothetical protein